MIKVVNIRSGAIQPCLMAEKADSSLIAECETSRIDIEDILHVRSAPLLKRLADDTCTCQLIPKCLVRNKVWSLRLIMMRPVS